ncbi:Uncharacterised protein [Acetobacterium wieringae]|nr:Uncharacterised protein [Acetobacterium wieringae]
MIVILGLLLPGSRLFLRYSDSITNEFGLQFLSLKRQTAQSFLHLATSDNSLSLVSFLSEFIDGLQYIQHLKTMNTRH